MTVDSLTVVAVLHAQRDQELLLFAMSAECSPVCIAAVSADAKVVENISVRNAARFNTFARANAILCAKLVGRMKSVQTATL
jgi:hypothetical protein